MKHIIRKILKENRFDKYHQKIVDDVRKGLITTHNDAITRYALTEDLVSHFEKIAIEKLNNLIGEVINTDDYPTIKTGTYSFIFNIYNYLLSENVFSKHYITLRIELNDGEVTILSEEPNKKMNLKDALFNKDYSWEVQMEFFDIVRQIIINQIPELLLIDSQLAMGNIYSK